MASSYDCLQPPASLLVKLGYLAATFEKDLYGTVSPLERTGAKDLVNHPDVQTWLLEMEEAGMLLRKVPVRTGFSFSLQLI